MDTFLSCQNQDLVEGFAEEKMLMALLARMLSPPLSLQLGWLGGDEVVSEGGPYGVGQADVLP